MSVPSRFHDQVRDMPDGHGPRRQAAPSRPAFRARRAAAAVRKDGTLACVAGPGQGAPPNSARASSRGPSQPTGRRGRWADVGREFGSAVSGSTGSRPRSGPYWVATPRLGSTARETSVAQSAAGGSAEGILISTTGAGGRGGRAARGPPCAGGGKPSRSARNSRGEPRRINAGPVPRVSVPQRDGLPGRGRKPGPHRMPGSPASAVRACLRPAGLIKPAAEAGAPRPASSGRISRRKRLPRSSVPIG